MLFHRSLLRLPLGIGFAILVICVPEKNAGRVQWEPERAGEMPGGGKSWGLEGQNSLTWDTTPGTAP